MNRILRVLAMMGICELGCADNRLIRIWDMTGSTIAILKGHNDYVYEVVSGTQGKLLSCGEDHSVVSRREQTELILASMGR
jgi:WD40 repeat protein